MGGVGMDITRGHCVVLELASGGLQYKLGRAAILPGFEYRPDDPARKAGETPFAGALGTIPRSLRKGGAMVSLSGRDTLFRMTDAGADDAAANDALVRLEVDELTSGNTPMVAAHQIVHSPDGGRKLLIGVAREGLIAHFNNSMRAAGLTTAGFVPAPVALYHCYLMSGNLDHEGVVMLANIGETATDVILVASGELLFARTIDSGVSAFIDALAQDLGINKDQARETLFSRIDIRPGSARENVSGERAVASAQDAAARLFAKLSGMTALAKGQLGSLNIEVERVTICGAGAAIKGMRDFFSNRFKKPVELLNPLSGIDTTGLDDAALSAITPFTPALAIALGLAKIAADGGRGGIVLLPPGAVERKRFLQRSAWLYAGIVMVAATLGFVLLKSAQVRSESGEVKEKAGAEEARYLPSHNELAQKPVQGADVRAKIASLSRLNQDLLVVRQRLHELCEVRRPGADALRLFNDAAAKAPKEVTLTDFALEFQPCGKDNQSEPVAVMGLFIESAGRKPDVVLAAFIEDIRKRPEIGEVIPSIPAELADGSGHTVRVTLRFKPVDVTPETKGGAE